MDRGRITAIVIGALLVLLSLALLGAGGTALWADRTQRDGGYATTDVHEFSTSGSALATVSTELGSAGGRLASPDLLDEVRIRVTPTSAGPPLFVGIGPSTDVDRYLTGVHHTVINEFWGDKTETVDGGSPASAPRTGLLGRVLHRLRPADPGMGSDGRIVDGRRDERRRATWIDVGADLGAKLPALPWIGLGVLIAGAVLLAGGGLLIAGAIRAAAPAKRPRRAEREE